MPPPPLTRKERRYARHREEILAAALTLFSENGFHNVTMQQIAQVSEFSVGKLYTFFANKEELYQALIKEKAEELYEKILAELSRDADVRDVLEQATVHKIDLFVQNSDIIRLILSETTAAGYCLRAGLNCEIRAQYEALLQTASRLFEKGIRSGRFVAGNPYLYAVALDGMTNAMVVARMERPQQTRAAVSDVCRLFFNGISVDQEENDA